MASTNSPVYLDILLYLIYVLVPLVPSILIYKIFPETKVGTEGFLGQLKINATGAFAAYIIVIVIGYFIIQNIQTLINASSYDNSAWFVKSKVRLIERRNNNEFVPSSQSSDANIKANLEIKPTPDYSEKNAAEVSFPMYYKDGYSKISFSYPGFESQVIGLTSGGVTFHPTTRTIDLGTVDLVEIKQVYNQGSIQSNPDTFATLPKFN